MRRTMMFLLLAVVLFWPVPVDTAADADQGQGSQARQSRPPAIGDRTDGMRQARRVLPAVLGRAVGHALSRDSRFNQEVLYLTGLASGLGSNDIGLDRAQLGGTRIVRFERVGPKVLMVEPNYDYRATSTECRRNGKRSRRRSLSR